MRKSRIHPVSLIALLTLAALACNLPASPGVITAVQPPPKAPLALGPVVTVPPGATPTPTPFLPVQDPPDLDVSPTPEVTVVNRTTENCPNFPLPTEGYSGEMPIPVCPQIPQPENQFNILLLGSDQRPDSGGFRTDTMILVTLDPDENKVSMTSFPRDLYVYIPGWTMQRLNTAHAHGDFPMMQLTFQYNFGVRPDRYVMINFWAFQDLITSLGGIDVDVAVPLTDHRSGFGDYTIPAGRVHMDADTALWYVRSRYSSSDFERTQRQQEVIVGLFNKLISLDALERAPEIYEIYKDSVLTDLTFAEMAKYLPLAAQLIDGSNVDRFFIGRGQVQAWRTPGGAQVLLPIRDAVLEVMQQALNSQASPEQIQ